MVINLGRGDCSGQSDKKQNGSGEDLWDVRSGGSVTGMERGINSNESVRRDCFEP